VLHVTGEFAKTADFDGLELVGDPANPDMFFWKLSLD
jgi:hypothetical protein